jgi:hypothetical protein
MALNNLPLVVDDQIDVDRACEQIGAAWHTTIESLFKIVDLFRECLNKKGFKELQVALEDRGIMKSSVFSMFKSIAQNPALNRKVQDQLPPAYNTLYYLSRIEDQSAFKKLISNGTINRDTTLEDAKRILLAISGESREEYDKTKAATPIMPIASIKIKREEFRKNRKRIFELLEELEGLGLIVNRSDELK